MNKKGLFQFVIVLVSFLISINSFAVSYDNDAGIPKDKLVQSIKKNTSLSDEQIESLIQTLTQQFNVRPDQKIPIQGYLYADGMNGAFLFDHDTWLFDAALIDPATKEIVRIPELFLCDFHNGGLKFEIAYKWMFTFIPNGVSVDELNGGLYGRGVGVVADAFLGAEGSWMPAKNRSHDIFHVALKVGFGGGLIFPKMEFKLRQIKDEHKTAKK
ncbi:hypothetical protein [Bdellovibrio sp. HCB209]|uniref:hypothetical protein n=1 Tax=Bdellovibrio sp. HCB209 TaxID=3394354 RepID=UPI0039B52F35